MIAKATKSISVKAVVYRANGVIEDLGTIAFHHRNPLRQLIWRITKR